MGTSLLLSVGKGRTFSLDTLEQVFASDGRFQNIRREDLIGSAIEADFVDVNDWTLVNVSDKLDVISFSGTTDASLSAALILQECHKGPMRLFDTNYSFDIDIKNFSTIDALRTAMISEQKDPGFWD